MAENTNNFNDPLDALIMQHSNALGITPDTAPETVNTIEPTTTTPTETEVTSSNEYDLPEIDYGENDLDAEIRSEEEAEEARRQEALRLKHEAEEANAKTKLPPRSLDKDFQAEAIEFQGEKLVIVSNMVKEVLAQHNITSGHIDPDKEFALMGELVDIYHNNGEVITHEFEELILSNWIYEESTENTEATETPTTVTENKSESTSEKTDSVSVKEDKPEPSIININVEKNTPVTVNVDESIVGEMKKSQAINIYVKEITEKDLKKTTIIENSNRPGLIKPYDSGINDTPITLPMSAYRCVMRPINWFDFIKLSSPTSDNPSDIERKKWSVIYDHMKNVSIGDFANFEDFLKKTKYSDRELLMWAILVGTADDEEHIVLKCGNPKCGKEIKTVYHPREIIKLDEDRIPKYYNEMHNASTIEESYKIWEKVAGSRRRYQLPNTKIIVEINEPSAYEFITNKLRLTQELYDRYRPGEKLGSVDLNDRATAAQMMEFEYIAANALMVSAMSIPDGDKEYRYTNWEDIEKIITTMLDAEDSSILLQIVTKARDTYVTPVTFKLDHIECEHCKHINEDLVINDIAESLLFQVSRRLASTDINLIEMP